MSNQINVPKGNSFEAINCFVNGNPSPEYEELQWALLGLAANREKNLKRLRKQNRELKDHLYALAQKNLNP